MKTVIRWCSVLPAAAGAYFATVLAGHALVAYLSTPHAVGSGGAVVWAVILDSLPLVSDVLFRAVGVYVAVIVGAAVAPRAKFAVALALTVIAALTMIGGTMFVMLTGVAQYHPVAMAADVVFSCGAAAGACVQEHRTRQVGQVPG